MCLSYPGVSIQWEASAYTASEGSGTVQLLLLKVGSTDRDVSVEVMTVAGSAVGTEDTTSMSTLILRFELTYIPHLVFSF